MSKTNGNQVTIEDMPIVDFERRVAKTNELIDEIKQLFPGMIRMSAEERRHAEGRYRDGEDVACSAVLQAVDYRPAAFSSLAEQNGGKGSGQFDTDLIRDRLRRRQLLKQVADVVNPLVIDLDDTVMHLGAQARPPVLAAYQIAKSLAPTDRALRTLLAPALDFYRRLGRGAAATRAPKPPAPAQP